MNEGVVTLRPEKKPTPNAIIAKIARKRGLITSFGKFLDPIADKFMVIGTMFVVLYKFPNLKELMIASLIIVIFREFAVTSVRLAASAQGVVIPANLWGKAKTVSQMISTILIMLLVAVSSLGVLPESFPLNIISQTLLWITAVLAVVSGVIYIKDGVKQIDFSK